MIKRKSGAHSAVMKLLLFTLAVAAFYGSYYLGTLYAPRERRFQNYVGLETPQPITNLRLLDQYGNPFDEQRLSDHWNLVIFGNTKSAHYVNQDLTLITQVKNRLAINPDLQKKTRGLFVTIDPKTDTPEVLHEYMSRFSPDFFALTGSVEAIESFVTLLGADNGHLYGTENAKLRSSIALVGPNSELIGWFIGAGDAASIASEISQLVLDNKE